VIIGHIYSASSRPEDIGALKKLYTPFVPAERIVTMDAYSAELGRMGQTAMLAHQMGAMASLGVLSEKCEASTGAVGWMLGFDTAAVEGSGCGSSGLGGLGVGGGFREVRSEVMCLVSLAKELGMEEVAEYWGSLLKMQEFLVRRAVKGLVQQLGTDEAAKKAAITITVLGFDDEGEMGTIVVKELRSAGLNVRSLGDGLLKNRVERELGDGIEVVESIEAACLGSSGVVLLGATATRALTEAWQEVIRGMRQKKLLTLGGRLDGVKMKQLGFEVV
jgi:UDPglucose 6-dehydrogenase